MIETNIVKITKEIKKTNVAKEANRLKKLQNGRNKIVKYTKKDGERDL
jgi:hypothetical protein